MDGELHYFLIITVDCGRTYHLTLSQSAKDINETAIGMPYTWSYTAPRSEEEDVSTFWSILLSTLPICVAFVVVLMIVILPMPRNLQQPKWFRFPP